VLLTTLVSSLFVASNLILPPYSCSLHYRRVIL